MEGVLRLREQQMQNPEVGRMWPVLGWGWGQVWLEQSEQEGNWRQEVGKGVESLTAQAKD